MIDKKEIRKMLVRTERARKSVLQPYFAEIGLPLGQGHVRILESLLAADHITQKELADRCHVDVTTMSRSLDRLEEAGFLERRRDPGQPALLPGLPDAVRGGGGAQGPGNPGGAG